MDSKTKIQIDLAGSCRSKDISNKLTKFHDLVPVHAKYRFRANFPLPTEGAHDDAYKYRMLH
jgi:hypothetical protein